jgi:hypothetical protein
MFPLFQKREKKQTPNNRNAVPPAGYQFTRGPAAQLMGKKVGGGRHGIISQWFWVAGSNASLVPPLLSTFDSAKESARPPNLMTVDDTTVHSDGPMSNFWISVRAGRAFRRPACSLIPATPKLSQWFVVLWRGRFAVLENSARLAVFVVS